MIAQTTSQCKSIREYLETHGSITPMDALNLFGCFRLGARIYDLRHAGCQIGRRMEIKDGKHYARYFWEGEE